MTAASILRRTRKGIIVLWQTGPGPLSRIAFVSFVLPLVMDTLVVYAPAHQKIKKLWQLLVARVQVRRYRRRSDEFLALGPAGYRLALEDLGLSEEQLEIVDARLQTHPAFTLADIDQDGFVLSHVGPIRGMPCVPSQDFVERKRFRLTLVAQAGAVGIKKDYRGNRLSFVSELRALHELGRAGCSVPALMDIDFDRLTLTFSYIRGKELRPSSPIAGRACSIESSSANPYDRLSRLSDVRSRPTREGRFSRT